MKLRLTRPTTPDNVFQALAQALDELERRIAFGTGQAVFSGIASNAVVTIPHELNHTPQAVLATCKARSGVTAVCVMEVTATATQITVRAQTVDGQVPAGSSTVDFWWLAIL